MAKESTAAAEPKKNTLFSIVYAHPARGVLQFDKRTFTLCLNTPQTQ